MKCKFCGCTDDKACMIPVCTAPDGDALERARSMVNLPCEWVIENVCSNPKCVDKAYAEAELLADQLQFFIERSA